MRSDMKKVVTERPRGGGGVKSPKGENRFWQDCSPEDFPKREKIRAKWVRCNGGKFFTDVLGPLHRFLLKQVGRPWDAVYSEIARNLPKTSMQNRHVYTHLWEFVEKNVDIVGGQVVYQGGRWHGKPVRSFWRFTKLYVHPVNGLLCKAKKGPSFWRGQERQAPPMPGVKVYPGVQYHKVKSIWYEVRVDDFVLKMDANRFPVVPGIITDEVLGCQHQGLEELKRVYGGLYLAVSKRPLKKREIRFACLK